MDSESSNASSSSGSSIHPSATTDFNARRISQIPKKLDGFVVVDKEWTLLVGGHIFSLPRNVVLSILTRDRLKGVKCLKNCKVAAVALGSWQNLSLYQLVCVPTRRDNDWNHWNEDDAENTEHAENAEEDENGRGRNRRNLDFDKIRDAFIKSVDATILEMGPFTNVYEAVKTHACCDTYAKRVNTGCPLCGGQREPIKVIASEIERFGSVFTEFFQNNLDERFPEVRTYLFGMETGQSAAYDTLMKTLSSLNLTKVHEVVIHIAADVKSPVGYVYFWRREQLGDFENRIKSTNTYYIAFIATVGNFVLNFKQKENYDEEENEEYEEENDEESYSADCQLIKFYSSLFRELAKNKPKPFTKPVLGEFLKGTEPKDKSITVQLVHSWISAIKESIKILDERQSNVVRCEAIISISNPGSKVSTNVFSHISKKAKKIFDEQLDVPFLPRIAKVEYRHISTHIKNTLLPLLNTLENIANDFVARRADNPYYTPSLDTFILASICECLVCFYIYGNATYRENKILFSRDLVNALSLGRGATIFRTGGVSAVRRRGAVVDPVFLSLEQLGRDDPNDGLRIRKYLHHSGKEMVRQEGRCTVEKEYLQPLEKVLGKVRCEKFYAIVKNFPEPEAATFAEKNGTLNQIFWKLLQVVSFERLSCWQPTLPALCDVMERAIDLILQSSRDFVRQLFLDGCTVSQHVHRFICILQHNLPRRSLEKFVEQSAMYMERCLYEESGAFLFPAVSGSERVVAICILPMFRLENFDYQTLSREQKILIETRYGQAHRNLTGSAPFHGLTQFVGIVDWNAPFGGCIAYTLSEGLFVVG